MSQNKVTVLALIKAKEGMQEQLKQELISLIGPTHKEAGCIDYLLHQARDDKTRFMFYENWTSQAALDEHLRAAHLQAFVAKAEQLLAEPLDVTLWERIG